MDDDERWRAIERQRLAVADLLATLSPADWEAPSLCADWRIRDVVGHLVLCAVPPSPGKLVGDLVRARGSFHRLNTLAARRSAESAPEALVERLRSTAASRELPVVTRPSNVLFDVQVHALDIALPAGRELELPVHAAAVGADRVWAMGWPFRARRRLAGLRLIADDVEWSAGEGAEVTGPIHALLLLLTGRTAAAAPLLSGTGLSRLPVDAR